MEAASDDRHEYWTGVVLRALEDVWPPDLGRPAVFVEAWTDGAAEYVQYRLGPRGFPVWLHDPDERHESVLQRAIAVARRRANDDAVAAERAAERAREVAEARARIALAFTLPPPRPRAKPSARRVATYAYAETVTAHERDVLGAIREALEDAEQSQPWLH